MTKHHSLPVPGDAFPFSMKRLFAILAFAFAGLAAELANPVQCTLLHTSRQHRPRKPGNKA